MKNLLAGLTVLVATLLLGACASTGTGIKTMHGASAGDSPPAASRPSGNEFTHDYLVTIYPGVGAKFDPNPRLSLEEYNQLVQLDWYCTKQVERFSGQLMEMGRQGITYGLLEGFLGAAAAKWAFGPAVTAAEYFKYIAGTAAGGGLASGKITYEMALAVAHGYCMTGMVYKADELDHELRRVFIVPAYTGKARLPEVSDRRAPDYKNERQGGFIPPPPR